MNIQQYFEEKEQKEQENAEQQKSVQNGTDPIQPTKPATQSDGTTVIPVIQETATIHTEVVETAKIRVHTHITEEENNLAVPLTNETYEVRRVPIGELIDERPPVRQEGNCTIIPVVEEVLVVQKRLKLVEEVHLVKTQNTVTHKEKIILKKEDIVIDRIPTEKGNDNTF